MKESDQIGTAIVMIFLIVNTGMTFAIGLEYTAVSWVILVCVMLFNIWLRLIQIADALTSKRTGSTASASVDDFAPRSVRHRG